MELIIEGLQKKIQELENRKSPYWKGVRDGYTSSLNFIKKSCIKHSGAVDTVTEGEVDIFRSVEDYILEIKRLRRERDYYKSKSDSRKR